MHQFSGFPFHIVIEVLIIHNCRLGHLTLFEGYRLLGTHHHLTITKKWPMNYFSLIQVSFSLLN